MLNSMVKRMLTTILAVFIALPLPGIAQDNSTDFLPDYSLLQSVSDNSNDQRYKAPGADAKLTRYKSIIIDQPVIFLASNSPYKGVKPSTMQALAEVVRSSLTDALSDSYSIVEQAGPAVLYIGVALADIKVKKKGFNLLAYTPIGLVAGGVTSASKSKLDDEVKHMNLESAKIEVKVMDSQSGELLGASVLRRVGGKSDPES